MLVFSACVCRFDPDVRARACCPGKVDIAGSLKSESGSDLGRIEDVDLDNGIISVKRASWEGREQTPKTRNAVRKIGIDAVVVHYLRQQIGQRTIGYVFQCRNGTPLRENNVLKRELHPLLKELGIQKCGLHAFRHGRVSFLVENDVPLPMIRLWIGHGSDRMVARYTHASKRFHANVIAGLPSIANMQTEAA